VANLFSRRAARGFRASDEPEPGANWDLTPGSPENSRAVAGASGQVPRPVGGLGGPRRVRFVSRGRPGTAGLRAVGPGRPATAGCSTAPCSRRIMPVATRPDGQALIRQRATNDGHIPCLGPSRKARLLTRSASDGFACPTCLAVHPRGARPCCRASGGRTKTVRPVGRRHTRPASLLLYEGQDEPPSSSIWP